MTGIPEKATARPLALVTGASRGIGAGVARQLAAAGYAVVVSARRPGAAEDLAAALRAEGHDATAVAIDLVDPASIAAAAARLGDRPLAVLVNNAAAFADWAETGSGADLDVARAVLDTNLFGTWSVTQAFLPALRRAAGACIVFVGSGGGSHGDPQFGLATNPVAASYGVSKAAVHALASKLATELRPEGIRVHVVDPGLTATAPGMEAMGARPVEDGARSVLWPVLHGSLDTTGSFTRDGQELPW